EETALPTDASPGQTPLLSRALPPPGGPASSAADAPVAPQQADLPSLPGYEILEVLGQGGQGVVIRARQINADRIVAIKMISPRAPVTQQDLTRFFKEIRGLARLKHPNVVQLYEVGEPNDRAFFSMEFVEGGSLARKLNGTPLPAGQAARVVE